MRLIVLDTNVIVSASISDESAPFTIVFDIVFKRQAQIVTCPSIVAEYEDVTSREKFRRYGFPPEWLELLIRQSLSIPDPPPWPSVLPDPSDAPFLALAQRTGAWLITGNIKHFPSTLRRTVSVVTPAEYLEALDHPKQPSE